MLIMAERVNHPPHYNAGGIECIDALEAATSGLQGIEAFCTANAIKYLWRWKLKNGEEDLQKAVWYINRLIQRAGADSAAGKELFNMKENKHGFEPKQEFTMGGIAWTVIQTGADWVKCIASDCVEERAFDEGNKNDFAASSLRAYLNGEFLRRLIKAGAPEEMFEYFNIDLTADDGLKNYGGDRVRIGLITCEEYRLLRGNIPALPDRWWWTATPDSPINPFVRLVRSDGSSYVAYIISETTAGSSNATAGAIHRTGSRRRFHASNTSRFTTSTHSDPPSAPVYSYHCTNFTSIENPLPSTSHGNEISPFRKRYS